MVPHQHGKGVYIFEFLTCPEIPGIRVRTPIPRRVGRTHVCVSEYRWAKYDRRTAVREEYDRTVSSRYPEGSYVPIDPFTGAAGEVWVWARPLLGGLLP